MTRQSYAHELASVMSFPVAVSLIEGTVIGVLAKKAFDVPNLALAVILASPMFAMVTSFVWARLARGRSKVGFLVVLMGAVLVCVAAIALLPRSLVGAWSLAGLMVVTRCLLAGMVTIRSVIWRNNYPRLVRASVAGRLTVVQNLIMAGCPAIGYAFLDVAPWSFRILYPLAAVLGAFGVIAMSRVRMRQERRLLRYELAARSKPQPRGEPTPIYEYDPTEPRATVWSVLRQDRTFRWYQISQFFAGSSNMMSETVMILVIAELTRGLAAEYAVSIALTQVIPLLAAVVTMPLWARYLDRVHIVRFRRRQGVFWLVDQLLNLVGAWFGLLPLLAVARVMQGTMRGGGMLAWQLGHNDFADRRLVALYMGIHVTLTGVRGSIAPFLAVGLYAGWAAVTLPLPGGASLTLPGFEGLGALVFCVSGYLAVVGFAGFIWLGRRVRGDADAGS